MELLLKYRHPGLFSGGLCIKFWHEDPDPEVTASFKYSPFRYIMEQLIYDSINVAVSLVALSLSLRVISHRPDDVDRKHLRNIGDLPDYTFITEDGHEHNIGSHYKRGMWLRLQK